MRVEVVTTEEPVVEPLTVDEVKLFARIDDDSEDALISAWITGARRYCENYTKRSFVVQKYRLVADCWAEVERCGLLRIPMPPLVSVESIAYMSAGELVPIDPSEYQVSPGTPGRVRMSSFPSTDTVLDAIQIEFTAGYSTVPPALVQAMRMLILQYHEHRVAVSEIALHPVPYGVHDLLNTEGWAY